MVYWFLIYSGIDETGKKYKNQAERFDTEEDAERIKNVYRKFDWIEEIYVAKEVKR